ncbi:hypothetical protein ACFP1H_12585 [Secundilactobacillus hailunensis]|uniref:Uncharacterized protein n=1 Tax=Secundilactobacillus hailunensis TaxID=2559923 RepID=A0ABW1TEY9_9LACO|nr:hypothetical protein [Secundilactobacillus hailunensis]
MSGNQFTPRQRHLFSTQLVVQGSALVALVTLLFKMVDSHFQFLTGSVLIAMLVIILMQWGLGAVIASAQKRAGKITKVSRNWLPKLAMSFEAALFLILGIYFLSQV